jgi:NadR type nicotinamide-nucleotide adenylyltransferase
MKRGLIVGKFYPPHAGHHYLIDTGKANCDELTVLVCDRAEYHIPAKLRAQWLRAAHPGVIVRVIADEIDDSDSVAWAKNALKLMDGKIDVVFTSESYGDPWAKAIGYEHHLVDIDRRLYPCSGTMVRKDPFANWRYLNDDVRAYFALRICLVGAESTGKTTLSKDLAKHYSTAWVPEYGRQYTTEFVKDVWDYTWTDDDFMKIAKIQNEMEDAAAGKANKVLICDTDIFATSIWYRRYFGTRSPTIEQMATDRLPMALYIVPDPTTPFDQDGYRDGEDIRAWMHQEFIKTLQLWGKDYLLVTGTRQERLAQAVKVIDRLIAKGTGLSGKEIIF